jgi:hypothetical protein
MGEYIAGRLGDKTLFQTTNMNFILCKRAEGKKTDTWDVRPRGDMYHTLGEIRWFGRWRCYAFFPAPDCVFEKVCLRDLADFCETATTAQRKKK